VQIDGERQHVHSHEDVSLPASFDPTPPVSNPTYSRRMAFRLSAPHRTLPASAVTALILGTIVTLAVAGRASGQTVGPFALDPLPIAAARGTTFEVTGSGCSPTGAFPTDHPVHLYLTPPSGGNSIGPGLLNGQVAVFMTSVGIAGEVEAFVTPGADGSFTAAITVPDNAQIANGYSVRGLCLTGLVADESGPAGFTQASYDVAFAMAGTLEVQPAPASTSTSTHAPTTSTTAIPLVSPSFTG